MVERGGAAWPSFASTWWKDLMALEDQVGKDWFNSEVVRKVGNWMDTRFWLDPWVSHVPLRMTYPRLFAISTQRNSKVGEVWHHLNGNRELTFSWRRELFV